MPKDEWRRARDRDIAKQARLEYATNGSYTGFESVLSDLTPTVEPTKNSKNKGSSKAAASRKSNRSSNVAAKAFVAPQPEKRVEVAAFLLWLNGIRDRGGQLGVTLPRFRRRLTPSDRRVIPLLLKALRGARPMDLPYLAEGTRQIGEELIVEVAKLLDDRDPAVAAKAAELLGRTGKAALPVVPILQSTVTQKRPHPKLKIAVEAALIRLARYAHPKAPKTTIAPSRTSVSPSDMAAARPVVDGEVDSSARSGDALPKLAPGGIEERLTRIVSGGLQSYIDAHGPITRQWIGSAAKRVVKSLSAQHIDTAGREPARLAYVSRLEREVESLQKKLQALRLRNVVLGQGLTLIGDGVLDPSESRRIIKESKRIKQLGEPGSVSECFLARHREKVQRPRANGS